MAIRRLLQKIIRSKSNACESKASSQPIKRPVWAGPCRDDVIAYAVKLSGLVIDEPEALALYRKTFADHPDQFVTYNDLRKQGDLLNKDALKILGLRANVKLSAQFLATLNENGRDDPMGAASVIGLTISTALCSWRDLQKLKAANTDIVKFQASNMAAGPCSCAASLDGKRLSVSNAKLLPFETCPHPDQCACSYQAWFEFMEELAMD